MGLVEYSIYFGCGILCLVLGFLLLAVRVAVGNVHPYRRAKKFLGVSALLNSVVCTVTVVLVLARFNHTLIDIYFVPMIYYGQLYLMCFSLLANFHSKRVNRRNRLCLFLPVVVITVAYAVCYHFSQGFLITPARYAAFIQTMPAFVVTHLLYAATLVVTCVCLYWMVKEARRYRRHIENYFSDAQLSSGMWTYYLVYVYVAYVVVLTLGVYFVDASLHCVFMMLNTFFLMAATMVMLNLHHTFFSTIPAVSLRDAEDEREEAAQRRPAKGGVGVAPQPQPAQQSDAPQSDDRTMQSIIDEWTQRRPLPYMRSGVTLAIVAGEMGVNVSLLSFFINRVYGVNFNAWLNRLRIVEVRRLLDADPTVPLADLAERAGFTDASAMGKVFKKFVGVTPSVYRSSGLPTSLQSIFLGTDFAD